MINKKMANILGMDIPEEPTTGEVIVVEPHEVVRTENPDLPAMHDIDRKTLQAEKELQEIIDATLGYQRALFDEVGTVEPKYRSRYIEVANGTTALALDAIKTKIKSQEEKKKLRMKEAEFQRPTGQDSGQTTNNFFFGSREEVMAMINAEPVEDDETDTDS